MILIEKLYYINREYKSQSNDINFAKLSEAFDGLMLRFRPLSVKSQQNLALVSSPPSQQNSGYEPACFTNADRNSTTFNFLYFIATLGDVLIFFIEYRIVQTKSNFFLQRLCLQKRRYILHS